MEQGQQNPCKYWACAVPFWVPFTVLAKLENGTMEQDK